jgi:hypothetical protein
MAIKNGTPNNQMPARAKHSPSERFIFFRGRLKLRGVKWTRVVLSLESDPIAL